jgi:hypothetical protein
MSTPQDNPTPKAYGWVDWMPRLKKWRVIEYRGSRDVKHSDHDTKEEAEDALRRLVASKRKRNPFIAPHPHAGSWHTKINRLPNGRYVAFRWSGKRPHIVGNFKTKAEAQRALRNPPEPMVNLTSMDTGN